MKLADEMKEMFISVGNKTLDVNVAIERMKELKKQYHIPRKRNKGKKYDTEFCEAYSEATKDISHEEHYAELPFEYMSYLAKGLELINNVHPAGKTLRMRKEELELVFKVDVGNMPTAQARAVVRRLIRQFWSKKTKERE